MSGLADNALLIVAMARLAAASPQGSWEALPPAPDRAWSDDFASILPYMLWDKVL